MRRRRWIGAATIVGAVLAAPIGASADGGAYIDLDRTHYLPGETAQAEGYVYVPASRQDVFERGPFYLFVVPGRSSLIEGRPVPDDAVRVATVSIEQERGKSFELHASFVVPDLDGDSYDLAVCNDPCTVSGFREPLTGSISIVTTVREGELLTEISRLNGRTWSLRRQIRKAERATEEVRAQLFAAEMARSDLASELRELTTDPRPVRAGSRRPLIPAWAAVIPAIALLVLAAAIVIRSRHRAVLSLGPMSSLHPEPSPDPEPDRDLITSR